MLAVWHCSIGLLRGARGSHFNYMTVFTRPLRLWRSGSLAAVFIATAWALRRWGGYPRCRNDELNWIDIAVALDRDEPWPVSGPAFIHFVRALSGYLDFDYEQTFALMGVAGVVFAIAVLLLVYQVIAAGRMPLVLGCLALSTYFWAPLLEARPQQWGQVLVLCSGLCCWLWLHRRRGGVLLFVLLPILAITHILSHAIALWLCGILVLVAGRSPGHRRIAVLAALGISTAVYFVPGGPYAHMLRDVYDNHARRALDLLPQAGAALVAAALALALLAASLVRLNAWASLLQISWRHERLAIAGMALTLTVALALQAQLLPSQAWQPYGGSVWLFLSAQIGNLLYTVLVLMGLRPLMSGGVQGPIHPLMGRWMTWALVAFGMLCAAAVTVSLWLLDTNWLLRVLNYGVLFAAVPAALGLERANAALGRPVLLGAIGAAGVGTSLLFVWRHPAVYAC